MQGQEISHTQNLIVGHDEAGLERVLQVDTAVTAEVSTGSVSERGEDSLSGGFRACEELLMTEMGTESLDLDLSPPKRIRSDWLGLSHYEQSISWRYSKTPSLGMSAGRRSIRPHDGIERVASLALLLSPCRVE